MNLKKMLAGATTAAVMLGSLALPVFAGAGKAPMYNSVGYTCAAGASSTSGPTFGFAVLNTNSNGSLNVEVSLKGATPNATYDIYINQDPGGCPAVSVGTLTTNGKGNGNAHFQVPQVAGATMYWVSAVNGAEVLRSTAVASN